MHFQDLLFTEAQPPISCYRRRQRYNLRCDNLRWDNTLAPVRGKLSYSALYSLQWYMLHVVHCRVGGLLWECKGGFTPSDATQWNSSVELRFFGVNVVAMRLISTKKLWCVAGRESALTCELVKHDLAGMLHHLSRTTWTGRCTVSPSRGSMMLTLSDCTVRRRQRLVLIEMITVKEQKNRANSVRKSG